MIVSLVEDYTTFIMNRIQKRRKCINCKLFSFFFSFRQYFYCLLIIRILWRSRRRMSLSRGRCRGGTRSSGTAGALRGPVYCHDTISRRLHARTRVGLHWAFRWRKSRICPDASHRFPSADRLSAVCTMVNPSVWRCRVFLRKGKCHSRGARAAAVRLPWRCKKRRIHAGIRVLLRCFPYFIPPFRG